MYFLKNDPRSSLLWADHQDLQIVSNLYQIKIHILTTGIKGKETSRWTHLVPDVRLVSEDKNKSNSVVPDMWLLHQDSVHFDLIVRNSILSEKSGIFQEPVKDDVSMNVKKSYEEADKGVASEKEEEMNDFGSGYMGWEMEEKEKADNEDDLDLKKAFKLIRKDVQIMDQKLQELKTEKLQTTKQIKSLKNVKEDYKQCLEALSKETYERNKSETLNKVLKETIEAEKKAKENIKGKKSDVFNLSSNSEEEMSVDEEDSEGWRKQPKYTKKRKNMEEPYKCDQCDKGYKTQCALDDHNDSKHTASSCFMCDKCQSNF